MPTKKRSKAAPAAGPRIEIRSAGRLGAYARGRDARCRLVLARAARGLGLGAEHELSVLLCDGPTMRRINARWRGKDRPTNVLSFPASALAAGRRPPAGALGDIIIALPVLRREARDMQISFDDHFAHLLVHGLLHLLGHDHHAARDAARMEAEERRLLALAARP